MTAVEDRNDSDQVVESHSAVEVGRIQVEEAGMSLIEEVGMFLVEEVEMLLVEEVGMFR